MKKLVDTIEYYARLADEAKTDAERSECYQAIANAWTELIK